MFLKFLQISQENNFGRVSFFIKLQAYEMFKNTFFYRTPPNDSFWVCIKVIFKQLFLLTPKLIEWVNIFLKQSYSYPSPQKLLKFLRFQKNCLKVAYFFSWKEEVPFHSKSNIFKFKWKECWFLFILLKISLFLHIELKIFSYGSSGTSGTLFFL